MIDKNLIKQILFEASLLEGTYPEFIAISNILKDKNKLTKLFQEVFADYPDTDKGYSHPVLKGIYKYSNNIKFKYIYKSIMQLFYDLEDFLENEIKRRPKIFSSIPVEVTRYVNGVVFLAKEIAQDIDAILNKE